MKKPQSLRAAIEARNPDLKKNPDKLKLYVQDGSVSLRYGEAQGYQYTYRLDITIIDFTLDTDRIILPVTEWLRTHQPDLLLNHDRADRAIGFDVDIIDAESCDIQLSLNLTETVDIKRIGNRTAAVYRPEASLPDRPLTDPPAPLSSVFDDLGQLAPWPPRTGD